MRRRLILVAAAVAFAVAWFVPRSGAFLVRSNLGKADIIVVLAGDHDDVRIRRGLELLRQGYARELLVDANDRQLDYGETPATLASRYMQRMTPSLADQTRVCPIRENSTISETYYVAACLNNEQPRTILLVTHAYHTRRALSMFRARMPQYRWIAVGEDDPDTWGPAWWRRREWAKTTLGEWQRLVWWHLVDRWR